MEHEKGNHSLILSNYSYYLFDKLNMLKRVTSFQTLPLTMKKGFTKIAVSHLQKVRVLEVLFKAHNLYSLIFMSKVTKETKNYNKSK